jgi:hypothetical protein
MRRVRPALRSVLLRADPDVHCVVHVPVSLAGIVNNPQVKRQSACIRQYNVQPIAFRQKLRIAEVACFQIKKMGGGRAPFVFPFPFPAS